MSTEFLMVAQTNINYIRKFSEKLKAGMIAKAGMSLSAMILKADKMGLTQSFLGKQGVSKNIDCYEDVWAINFPELPLEEGTLKLEIEDENSKINLSVLSNEIVEETPYYGILQRFLLNMELSMDIADTIKDWVDADDATSPYGAESSDYYRNLDAPYKAKNAAMDSIDELLMIKDITPAIFYGLTRAGYEPEINFVDHNKGEVDLDFGVISEIAPDQALDRFKDDKDLSEVNIARERSRKLADYLRVNGERSDFTNDLNKININTASYRVLSALTGNITDDIVSEIIRRRLTQPYKDVEEIKDLVEDESIRKNILTVKSYLFKITATGTINKTSVRITGIYYRDRKRFLYWSEE
ncbi:MAG: general secretion pathway protein GspK [Spirochaetes bacterium]|nr:general secretion pathway protein GspK [Spirochaetota bacterium]